MAESTPIRTVDDLAAAFALSEYRDTFANILAISDATPQQAKDFISRFQPHHFRMEVETKLDMIAANPKKVALYLAAYNKGIMPDDFTSLLEKSYKKSRITVDMFADALLARNSGHATNKHGFILSLFDSITKKKQGRILPIASADPASISRFSPEEFDQFIGALGVNKLEIDDQKTFILETFLTQALETKPLEAILSKIRHDHITGAQIWAHHPDPEKNLFKITLAYVVGTSRIKPPSMGEESEQPKPARKYKKVPAQPVAVEAVEIVTEPAAPVPVVDSSVQKAASLGLADRAHTKKAREIFAKIGRDYARDAAAISAAEKCLVAFAGNAHAFQVALNIHDLPFKVFYADNEASTAVNRLATPKTSKSETDYADQRARLIANIKDEKAFACWGHYGFAKELLYSARNQPQWQALATFAHDEGERANYMRTLVKDKAIEKEAILDSKVYAAFTSLSAEAFSELGGLIKRTTFKAPISGKELMDFAALAHDMQDGQKYHFEIDKKNGQVALQVLGDDLTVVTRGLLQVMVETVTVSGGASHVERLQGVTVSTNEFAKHAATMTNGTSLTIP